ncbi:MAG: TIGR04283 family arsenosugar biosynthesis glycosyltransferase [Cyclobacteriaceae bacterium]|nr:TIGR04283 family arsenosugar biosynthesis glycosyltransferase [Cyclobacteriaceae bacterium]
MTISVIIPTFNEGEGIAELVTFIKHLRREEVAEILVVDGGSSDTTRQQARESGAIVINSGCRSRAIQMNLGARHALGDTLYFVHADVKLLPSFIDDINEVLTAGYDSGCYRYVFDSTKAVLKINAFFTRFDSIMCRGGDQTLFVRKSIFETLEGFNEIYSIMEEYDFLIRLRRSFSFKIIPKDIVVSSRKYEANSWIRVQIANLSVFILFFFRRSPQEMKQIYKFLLNYR